MDHNDYSGHGNVSLAVSLIAGMFAWIGSYSLPEVIKSLSMIVSIIAGIMAIRYYYYATKKQR
jgi:glucan phosphoethanolaminetransferase (alkaline phosphatase superfamily)